MGFDSPYTSCNTDQRSNMYTVRTIQNNDRDPKKPGLTDTQFSTKREALTFMQTLSLGLKPTIAKPERGLYVVTLKRKD